MTTTHDTPGPLDVLKVVVEALSPLDREKQGIVLRLASEYLGIVSVATPPGGPGLGAPPNRAPGMESPQDIRTFVRSKNPKSDQQLATSVAFYYRFVAPSRKESITADDLTEAIRLVGGWEQPKRPIMTLNNAKNQGYLDAVGDGKFQINSVGENLVTMTLGGDGSAPEGGKRRRPAKRRRTAGKTKRKT